MARWKLKNLKYFALCLSYLVTFSICFLLLKKDSIWPRPKLSELTLPEHILPDHILPEHTLCVLVPFRNAQEELYKFIPHMNEFLHRQSIRFHFIVISHVPDKHRFNRGAVFNAGFDIISKEHPDCDYIALHDVDLLPLNDEISYGYPGDNVFHVAPTDLRPGAEGGSDRGVNIAGIAIINREQYIRCNGFGNHFWGWGFEDRNFLNRMQKNHIKRTRPRNLNTNWTNTFKDTHSSSRSRDKKKCDNQTKIASDFAVHDFESGLNNVKYTLTSAHSLTIDEIPFSFYSISLPCDYSKTPWCKLDCTKKKKAPGLQEQVNYK